MIRSKDFMPSGKSDVYSDSTPCGGKPMDLASMSRKELLEIQQHLRTKPKKKHFAANPSAGDIHRQEFHAPWRKKVNEQTSRENILAFQEQHEKRIWGLAKQTHVGLQNSYNINFGVAELAGLLKVAAEQKLLEEKGEEVKKKDLKAAALLVAAQQYDLLKIVSILELRPRKTNSK